MVRRKVKKSFVDKCIKDKNNNIVLAQKPNLLIIVWIITVVSNPFLNGELKSLVGLISFGVLFAWAWLELFDGVNYFRRAIGLVVLIGLLYVRLL